jgi:hypothetical protein
MNFQWPNRTACYGSIFPVFRIWNVRYLECPVFGMSGIKLSSRSSGTLTEKILLCSAILTFSILRLLSSKCTINSWIKIDQLTSLAFFFAQHVSNASTFIFRFLRLCVGILLWFDVCWRYGVVRLGWCGILMQAEALLLAFETCWAAKK